MAQRNEDKRGQMTYRLNYENATEKTSFGEYFDNQHAAIVKAMQDKNKQLNVEWMERYEKRQKEKQAHQIIEEINNDI